MKMGLQRMRSFLSWLHDPHLAFPVIHIGGTNGKGSVSHMVSAVLQAAGYRVGTHTSPHLQAVNERFLINGAPISDDTLSQLLVSLDAQRRAWAARHIGQSERHPLTWFEFTTALAFQCFADAKVDVGVIEVGMGGRLDATNVVQPMLTSIVTVGLDHTDHLGPDHASIAGEKAGIIKPNVPIVVGPLPAEAQQVIRAMAMERSAPLYSFGQQFQVAGDPEQFSVTRRGRRIDGLRLGLAGHHQMVNAAVAAMLLDLLPPPFSISDDALRDGLAAARNPGRLEWLAPDLLVDGAHNPDGALVLASFLAQLPRDRKRTLVLGGGTDKDIRSVAATLAHQVDRIYTTACAHPKARTPFDVARQLEGLSVPVSPAGPIDEALPRARNGADLVIVAGSLYLVGAVRDLFGAT